MNVWVKTLDYGYDDGIVEIAIYATKEAAFKNTPEPHTEWEQRWGSHSAYECWDRRPEGAGGEWCVYETDVIE